VYGTAWATPDQLAGYQRLKAEAARRDHRKLGAELDLFSIQDSAGVPACVVFWAVVCVALWGVARWTFRAVVQGVLVGWYRGCRQTSNETKGDGSVGRGGKCGKGD
jgi:hypothetical protein